MRLIPFAAAAAALSIAAAGCGGSAGGPGAADGAATVVPASAVAFVAADTDLASSRWHGLGTFALSMLPAWGKELGPLAGDELDVAVLADDHAVAFVRPHDEAKLAAFAKRRGAALRKLGDWTALAADGATLAAVADATSHLADNTLFLDAMNHLPDGALVRAYANGEEANRLFASIPGQLESRLIPSGARFRFKPNRTGRRSGYGVGTEEFRWLAAALTSSDGGLRLDAVAPAGGLTAAGPPRLAVRPIAPYASGLVDEIPSGALAVVDFMVPPGAFELLPELPAGLRSLFGTRTFGLPNQLDELFGGETAIYVRPAFPTPEITLVTQPADTAQASSTLDSLLAQLPRGSMLAGLKLYRGEIGGQFVVSTTKKGIDDFRGGGAKLSADPGFVAARKQSGMPELTTGFVYASARDALPLLALAGVKIPPGLGELRTFTAYGAQQGERSTFSAFLGVG